MTAYTLEEGSIAPGLPPYKAAFLSACIDASALKFGTFTLKSGRQSPYFFNAGLFHKPRSQRALCTAFAETLAAYRPRLEFDILFGPAYKGIALAAVTIDKMLDIDEGRFSEVSCCYNRKEAKDHGEVGVIVGGDLKGKRVMIIDDVVTAGTAKREAIDLIKAHGGDVVGIIVALDRMETVAGMANESAGPSAISQIRREYGIPVLSILTLDELITALRNMGFVTEANRCDDYAAKYRATE